MQLNEFTYHSPKTTLEAIEILSGSGSEGVRINAGGTFLMNILKGIKKRGGKSPGHVLSLKRIPELKEIALDKESLSIGAMVTMREILDSELISKHVPVLQDVAKTLGNTPIRNMATIGGNLTCRYAWTELPAVMIALDANFHVMTIDQKEEEIKSEAFYQNAAKLKGILSKVTIPLNPEWAFAYQRATKTAAQDIPLLSVAVGAKVEKNKIQDVRVVINNGTAFAQRDNDLESYLKKGEPLKSAYDQDLPGMDKEIYTLRSDEYKQHMFSVCIKRALKLLEL